MPKYRLTLEKKYIYELGKIPERDQKAISAHVADLSFNPKPYGCVKLKGFDNIYRIRCGNYRILYTIFDDVLTILVITFGHRKNIYQS